MARKTKKKKSSTETIARAPIVNIKQRDDRLADDLKSMSQKDAFKHTNRLLKMISSQDDYADLVFNIPHLIHLLRRYEIEKKPSSIKSKLFKQTFAKEGGKYILPKIVDGPYITSAKRLIDHKFSTAELHEDKMALAIAKASLEMHGKVIQGTRISLEEIPLFQLSLSISLDILQKIAKNEKNDKDLLNVSVDSIADLYPRWHKDAADFFSKLFKEAKSNINESLSGEILSDPSTVFLQKGILTTIEANKIDKANLAKQIQNGKLKTEIISILAPVAEKYYDQEITPFKKLILSQIEERIRQDFNEAAFIFSEFFSSHHRFEEKLDIVYYLYQGLFHLNNNAFQQPSTENHLSQAKTSSGKIDELLHLIGAFHLGVQKGETVLQIGSLCKSLNLHDEGNRIYQNFLNNPKSKDDKLYKKIKKDYTKNFESLVAAP